MDVKPFHRTDSIPEWQDYVKRSRQAAPPIKLLTMDFKEVEVAVHADNIAVMKQAIRRWERKR